MTKSQVSLFNTVPKEDYCHLFERGKPNGKKVAELLNYQKKDIASAANIPISSVRYDAKMPAELKERLMEWAIALNLVAGFFKNEEKTILWFRTPNPLLGGMAPREIILVGRFKKLLKFIQTALDENQG